MLSYCSCALFLKVVKLMRWATRWIIMKTDVTGNLKHTGLLDLLSKTSATSVDAIS
jgi:hypothetical protein